MESDIVYILVRDYGVTYETAAEVVSRWCINNTVSDPVDDAASIYNEGVWWD